MPRGRKTTTTPDKKPIEQYEHKDKSRCNNPPVGLVNPVNDSEEGKKTYSYDPNLDPQLIWAGKTEHLSFEVPTISLHVHERIDPRSIIEAVRKRNGEPQRQASLFEFEGENPPLREAIEFYKHKHDWSNRLIAGDSLLVMNSLLEKEGMTGKVQMIYIDPPYGIKYGSNFQAFVNKRDVKDGSDEDLTQEPEMVKAFRDTWELGIHSYLAYLRDRLLLARELLHESGSVFVQISDENVHHVREIMDEVFGKENFVALIPFRKKTMPLGASYLERMHDFLIWYSKSIQNLKYHQLYQSQDIQGDFHWGWLELQNGIRRKMSKSEIENHALLPKGSKIFRLVPLWPATFSPNTVFPVKFREKTYLPPKGLCWVTSDEGIRKLILAQRIEPEGEGNLRYVYFFEDYNLKKLVSFWDDTTGARNQSYVIQTSETVIQRCILMTTDPGDLILDPTCGSGTTAYVSEQWGRRWITCDTSRIAITLAKQRLMCAFFEYYTLNHPQEGISSNFKYKISPRVSLKSIVNTLNIDALWNKIYPEIEKQINEFNSLTGLSLKEWQIPSESDPSWPDDVFQKYELIHLLFSDFKMSLNECIQENAAQVTLYDQPIVDSTRARVSGPFTIEAVPAPIVKPLTEVTLDRPADDSIARTGETLRQGEWRDEIFRTGIRGKSGQKIEFSRVEPLPAGPKFYYLHADAETKEASPERAVISFGPDHAPLEQRQVELAIQEAQRLKPNPKMIIFAAFHFDPEAAKDIDEVEWPGVTLLKVQMNGDLLTEDLKKKRSSNESFWLMGQPEIVVETIREGEDRGKNRVQVLGFDYYDTRKGEVISGGTDKIAMWMLDTDYDGRSLFPRQVFFPMAGEKEGWSRLARNLRAEIDEELIEAYRGTVSLPFEPGPHRQIAVKIIDDRGIESLRILHLEDQ